MQKAAYEDLENALSGPGQQEERPGTAASKKGSKTNAVVNKNGFKGKWNYLLIIFIFKLFFKHILFFL